MRAQPRLRAFYLGSTLAIWLLLTTPRSARAEGDLDYKYEDYQESGGRIHVQTHNAMVTQNLGTDTVLKVGDVIDSVAGATPNGQPAPAGSDQVVMTLMHQRRKAWNATLSHQFARINVSLGAANSRENDYVSTGVSLNTLTDFNDKNTTLLAGVAGTDDRVEIFYDPAQPYLKKPGLEAIVGVTQLIDPRTFISIDFTGGYVHGYLSDPHKVVQKTIELAPGISLPFTYGENRPGQRRKWDLLVAVNHAFTHLDAAAEASYRLYTDSWNITAHTLDASWLQRAGRHLILQPDVRLYQQTAARFYHYNLDATGIVPTPVPNPDGPFYSSDHRLSNLRTYAYGLKVIWNLTPTLQLNASLRRYEMHGRDGVTPASAYPKARIWNAGLIFSW